MTACPLCGEIKCGCDPGWVDQAACQRYDPELWFADSYTAEESMALRVCWRECPVREQCLAYALAYVGREPQSGIWGGHGANRRVKILDGLTADEPPRWSSGQPRWVPVQRMCVDCGVEVSRGPRCMGCSARRQRGRSVSAVATTDADGYIHGTRGGYSRHQRVGEEPCDECRAAERSYQRARARRRRRRAAA